MDIEDLYKKANDVAFNVAEKEKDKELTIETSIYFVSKKLNEVDKFFKEEKEEIRKNDEKENYKKRYELKFIYISNYVFMSQFLYAYLEILNTEKSKTKNKELIEKGFYDRDIKKHIEELRKIKESNFPTHQFDDFENYTMKMNAGDDFLQPRKKKKMGF